MDLKAIELEILSLLNGLSLRPTLERVVRVGQLLIEAKAQLRHGEWRPWVRGLRFSLRSAQIYMQLAKAQGTAPLAGKGTVTTEEFLHILRAGKKALKRAEREEARGAAARLAGPQGGRYQVHCSDCRRFPWPEAVDVVATDPPWQEPEAYQWLGEFARRLRRGGLALVQCATPDLYRVITVLTAAGLSYRWTLCMVYPRAEKTYHVIAPAWRPVVVLSRGEWDHSVLRPVCDVHTVSNGDGQKTLHAWQQPVGPWVRWLAALTLPGQLIVDPFAGSGTNGVAAKLVGERRFVGTEIVTETARAAQGRLAQTVEGEAWRVKARRPPIREC